VSSEGRGSSARTSARAVVERGPPSACLSGAGQGSSGVGMGQGAWGSRGHGVLRALADSVREVLRAAGQPLCAAPPAPAPGGLMPSAGCSFISPLGLQLPACFWAERL